MNSLKTIFVFAMAISFTVSAFSQEKSVDMNFNNQDITKMIEHYAKASKQKFIVDSTVRGKITMINPNELSLEEAYNQLSITLALNGFAIVKQGDILVVRNARSAQRDNLEVVTSVPAMHPERMLTWIINLKYASASEVMQQLRMLTSSYGEMSSLDRGNQLVISDWSANMQRVNELIKKIDVPMDPSIQRIVGETKKQRLEANASRAKLAAKEPKDSAMTKVPPAPSTDE